MTEKETQQWVEDRLLTNSYCLRIPIQIREPKYLLCVVVQTNFEY